MSVGNWIEVLCTAMFALMMVVGFLFGQDKECETLIMPEETFIFGGRFMASMGGDGNWEIFSYVAAMTPDGMPGCAACFTVTTGDDARRLIAEFDRRCMA